MTEFGEPITDEQFAWFVLKEIKSPVVGDLTMNSTPGYAIAHCKKDEVWYCLSSGEKRLVDIAWTVWNHAPHGEGLSGLFGLDRTLRHRIWVALGYLLMGHDVLNKTNWRGAIDFDKFKGGIKA